MSNELDGIVTDCAFFGTLPECHDLSVFLMSSESYRVEHFGIYFCGYPPNQNSGCHRRRFG